jgi:predicted phosphodiesterase
MVALIVCSRLVFAAHPILSFDVISDIHSANYTAKLKNAFADIRANDTGSQAVFMVGDLTQNARPAQYDTLMKVVNQNPALHSYFAIGNHDVRAFDYGYFSTYNAAIAAFKSKTGMPGAYYDTTIAGYHFIVLGSDKNLKDQASIGTAEISWFKTALAKNASPGKPIFIFLHQPLINTVANTYVANGYNVSYPDGVVQDSIFRAVLAPYPQAILFTGHTHAALTAANNYFKGPCHMVNVGAITNNQGLFVKVYDDSVAITGRNFSSKTTVWTKTIPYNHTVMVLGDGNGNKAVSCSFRPVSPRAQTMVSMGRYGVGVSGVFVGVSEDKMTRYGLNGKLIYMWNAK